MYWKEATPRESILAMLELVDVSDEIIEMEYIAESLQKIHSNHSGRPPVIRGGSPEVMA